uniref:Uncharacterized protein n=1 Tax=uncultured bacterium A1Q1_fos_600 TaxID=1256587 RepID=L7VYA6_9BACT|nr:hypothetical protein [uncultured bacterium A1Q1_fos_600]
MLDALHKCGSLVGTKGYFCSLDDMSRGFVSYESNILAEALLSLRFNVPLPTAQASDLRTRLLARALLLHSGYSASAFGIESARLSLGRSVMSEQKFLSNCLKSGNDFPN